MNEAHLDYIVEADRAHAVDALVDGPEGEETPARMSAEDWKRDSAEYLLNLSDEDFASLRIALRDLISWERLMMTGNRPDQTIRYSASLGYHSAEIAGLLVKSLLASGITDQHLEVK